jgi:hypothetical protein
VAVMSKIVLAGIALALSAPATAQLRPEMETGSLTRKRPKAVDPVRAGEIRKEFARCVYRRSKGKATALLNNSDPETVNLLAAEITDITDEMSMDSCLGSKAGFDESALGMKFSYAFIRDLLAEEAYLASNRTAPVLPPPPAVVPPLQPPYVSTGTRLQAAQAMVAFTDCAVLKDVAHADALLRTMPGSSEELVAAKALGPVLGRCLVRGQNLKLTAANIRAFIGYAMWNRFGRSAQQWP